MAAPWRLPISVWEKIIFHPPASGCQLKKICFLCRLFETLQSLFWSVFGLLNLYVTNVKARHEFTEFVGATMFVTYNVISLVVLLNMLIAMMNNSYQLIAVSYPFSCCWHCSLCASHCSDLQLVGPFWAAGECCPQFLPQVAGIPAHQPESCLWRRFALFVKLLSWKRLMGCDLPCLLLWSNLADHLGCVKGNLPTAS